MEKVANDDLKAHFEAARDLRRELALRDAHVLSRKRELLAKNQYALEQQFRSALTAADFDFDGSKTIGREMRADVERLANDAKANAGADHHGLMKRYVQQLRGELEYFGSLSPPLDPPPAPPYRIVLNTPYSIYTTSGLNASTNIAPLNSTAKFSFASSASSGYEELAFSFAWQNPYDAVVVMNLDAYPIYRGYCEAVGDNGIFLSGKSQFTVETFLNISGTNFVNPQTVAAKSADGGNFFNGGVGDIEWVDVYRGYDIQTQQLLVQPSATLQVDLVTSITYSTTGGVSSVQFEFSQNERAVSAYAVLLTIVS